MEKLISIDFKADFGFLRKPDTNKGVSMSYNMIHKPGLLGILGAILGLNGYQKRGELPEYYQKLQALRIGVSPLNHDNGNFAKTTIVYTNTVGYANKDGGTFIAYENTLLKPSYRVFIALAETHSLYQYLKKGEAEFIPYLGKNEFPIWWEPNSFKEYELKQFDFRSKYEVKTLFMKREDDEVRKQSANTKSENHYFDSLLQSKSFFYFERLPTGFQEFVTKRGKEYQYSLAMFVYSNTLFSQNYRLENLYLLEGTDVVQLN